MESIVLGTMAYAGNKLNNKKAKSKTKVKSKSKNKNTNQGGSTRDSRDVYNTNISEQIDLATKKQAEEVKEYGYAKQFDSIMVDNVDHVPVGVNQSYNTFNGYDMSLQRDLDFTNGYSEFSKTEMHYDVVSKNKMMTSNMAPHTSKREYTRNNDYSHLLGLHTGNDELYMSKEHFTPVTLFEPMKNLTYVNGAPVFTEYLEERYIPSYKNNNGNLPFKSNMKISPGLKDQQQSASSGNAVYRILPRTTDQIRGLNNPKVVYEAQKVESGKKGNKPAVEYKLTKYKRAVHKTRNEELPNYHTVQKHMRPGKFKNPNTNRSVSRDEFGHAFNSTEGHKLDGQYEAPFKMSHVDDSIERSMSNVSNKPVLQNSGSYSNYENERSTTNHNITGTLSNVNEGSYSFDAKDIPLTTLRQLMINGDTNIGVTQNKDGNSYVFSNDMVLPVTNRDTTGPLTKEGNVNPTEKFSNLKPTDIARGTVKETTTMNSVQGTLAVPENHTTYTSFSDNAKGTIRQTTSMSNVQGSLAAAETYNTYTSLGDKAKLTTKETTTMNGVQGSLAAAETFNTYTPFNDKAKLTTKETTTMSTVQGSMKPEYYALNLNNPDNARITVGETTSSMIKEGFMNPDAHVPNVQFTDNAKTTIGETTSSMVVEGSVNPEYYAVNLNNPDIARQTIGETTSSMTVSGSLNPEHKETHYYDPTNISKQTIKQTTSLSNYISNTLRSEGGVNYLRNKDNAKPTIKQSTLSSANQANVRSNNVNIIRSNDLNAKDTIKQTTLYSTGENNVGGDTVTYVKDYKDLPKATIKQSTLHSTQDGRAGRETIGYTRDMKDNARTTLKQTTIDNKYVGPAEDRVSKPESQQAARNIEIDDRREILTYNRPAGPKSDKIGPVINKSGVKLKEHHLLKRQNVGFFERNCDKLEKTFTRNKNSLNTFGYAINSNFTNTLKDNPLANALMHQKHQKE